MNDTVDADVLLSRQDRLIRDLEQDNMLLRARLEYMRARLQKERARNAELPSLLRRQAE